MQIALLSLFALPLVGAVLYGSLSGIAAVRQITRLVFMGSLALTLVAALIIRPTEFELVVGDWSPVSFTGTPLILITSPAAMSILAVLLLVMLVSCAQRAQQLTSSSVFTAVMVFLALAIMVLANDMAALLIGIGLVDTYSVLHSVTQSRQPNHALRNALYRGASLLVLLIAFALYAAEANSLYLPLARLPERFSGYVMASLALRFILLPLGSITDQSSEGAWVDKAGPLAGLLLIMRLPQLMQGELRAWFFGLALLTALAALIIGALSTDRTRLRTAVDTAALAVAITAAVTWNTGSSAIAAIAWLLGTTLLTQSATDYPRIMRQVVRVARLIGAVSLIGLPLTVGFIGRAGVFTIWAGRGAGGALLIAAFALVQLLLVICVLRLTLRTEAPAPDEKSSPAQWVSLATLVIASLAVLIGGLNPELATAPGFGTILARNQALDWVIWALPTLLGVAAWRFESRWLDWTTRASEPINTVINLNWWQEILTGAMGRIARLLANVLTYLESEGVLLWGIIVILIIVLVGRSSGP